MDNQQEINKNSRKSRSEIEATLVAKAWQNEDFRHELLSNTKAVIAREFDREISESKNIQVLEESNDTYYLVIPKKPDIAEIEELSEDQLEAIAGGGWKDVVTPDSITVGCVGWNF